MSQEDQNAKLLADLTALSGFATAAVITTVRAVAEHLIARQGQASPEFLAQAASLSARHLVQAIDKHLPLDGLQTHTLLAAVFGAFLGLASADAAALVRLRAHLAALANSPLPVLSEETEAIVQRQLDQARGQ